MNNSWALLFVLGFAGCASTPTPSPDWTQHITGSCAVAEQVLIREDCPEAHPRGTTWMAFCETAQASEGAIDLDVGCIASAASLEAVRGCHVRCRK